MINSIHPSGMNRATRRMVVSISRTQSHKDEQKKIQDKLDDQKLARRIRIEARHEKNRQASAERKTAKKKQ